MKGGKTATEGERETKHSPNHLTHLLPNFFVYKSFLNDPLKATPNCIIIATKNKMPKNTTPTLPFAPCSTHVSGNEL